MANLLWVKYAQNKHENYTAKFRRKFCRCTTNLIHPLDLAEHQDFAASVQTSLCPGWAFPAPCHFAPTPFTDPLTSRYLTSADLFGGGGNSRSYLSVSQVVFPLTEPRKPPGRKFWKNGEKLQNSPPRSNPRKWGKITEKLQKSYFRSIFFVIFR